MSLCVSLSYIRYHMKSNAQAAGTHEVRQVSRQLQPVVKRHQ